MSARGLALGLVLLVACGDDSGMAAVDSAIGDGSGSNVFNNIPCDYTETQDATNHAVAAAEPSGLTLGSQRIVLCGKFDTGHYDAATELVDADGIRFSVSTGQVIVHIIGDNRFNQYGRTVVQILKDGVNQLYGFGVVEGDHGTLTFNLNAGEYVAAMYTLAVGPISPAIDYKVLISTDTARCPAKTGTADHTEGGDGGMNDVINFDFAANNQSTLTSSTTDAPETTSATMVEPGSTYLISGDSANVDPPDDYMDRDTFQFTTGPTTTQMTIRLNWASTTSDLDYRVYPPRQSGIPSSIVGGVDIRDMEDEYETFAVQPSTSYWLWVAAEDGATVPAAYSATLCGETFTP